VIEPAQALADGASQVDVEAVSGREGLDKSVDGGSSVGKAFRLRKRLHGLPLSRFAPKACRSTPMWQLR
jgi:hypothetical protein